MLYHWQTKSLWIKYVFTPSHLKRAFLIYYLPGAYSGIDLNMRDGVFESSPTSSSWQIQTASALTLSAPMEGISVLGLSCKWPFRGKAGATGLIRMYVKHHTCLFCRFGVTPNVSHLWLSNLGDGIMKFCSQAEQAQLHGAHMQTFIIEQQAFIIHTGGFPCSPQINYEPALHTLTHWCWNTDGDEYLVVHRLCWQEPCLVIYSLKKINA